MLALLTRGRWEWAAEGKHPVASDFIAVGAQRREFADFAKLARQAWCMADRRPATPTRPAALRFWANSRRRGLFLCGLLSDSRDSLGREYPLLLLGRGSLPGWKERRESLAQACDETWRRLEAVAAGRYSGLADLERALGTLPQPSLPSPAGIPGPAWSGRRGRENGPGGACLVIEWDGGDAPQAIPVLAPGRPAPCAFFMAGDRKKTAWVYDRPLVPADLAAMREAGGDLSEPRE